jgi:hypothetical protein
MPGTDQKKEYLHMLWQQSSAETNQIFKQCLACYPCRFIVIVGAWYGVNDVRQTEVHTAEPLVPEPSAFEVEMAIEKLKRHKSPGIVEIPAELIKARGRTIQSEIHKLIISIWNKEELPEEWKESVIVPIYKKRDKTGCNYRDISLLSTTYKILCNIILSRLTPYAEEIIGDHQCGFRRNRPSTDHIFSIRQILEKKWDL